MGTPHKHAAIIKAWADGAEIEWRDPYSKDHKWSRCGASESIWYEKFEYRVKPEQVVKQCRAQLSEGNGDLGLYSISRESMNLKLTFEDGKLVAAEVI